MTGPGGDEVGRVSIRVVPSTERFDDDLRRELRKVEDSLRVTIPVDFDVDTAGLRAQIEAIRVPTVTVPVEFGDANGRPEIDVEADTASARREVDDFVRDTERRSPDVKVDVGIDRSAIDRALAAANARMRVEVDRDFLTGQITSTLGRIRERIRVSVDIDRNSLTSGLSGLQSAFAAVGRVGSAAFSGVGESLSSVTRSLGPVASVVGLLIGLPAIAVAIAAGGAAISAAWATASTAIAAVPAAIGLIGAPLAAVLLGMDGIKRAAQTLKPEFDALKASVSATFEQGLLPVFDRLRTIFPTLQTGLNLIADSLVSVASKLTAFITSARGTELVKTLFENVATAIDNAGLGLQNITEGFLRLAGNQAALQALVGTIEEIGLSLQSIADNPALDQAFAGLEDVLRSVLAAFTALINNGIEAFAAAAPGIKGALDGITEFFNKFDYASLGSSIGAALRGIGDALKSIPQGTVDAIVEAFRKLGEVLSSGNFQSAVRNVADSLPGLITSISEFIDGAADIINKVTAIGGAIEAAAKGDFSRAGELIKSAFSDVTPSIDRDLARVPPVVQKHLSGVKTIADRESGFIGPVITKNLDGVPPAVGKSLAPTTPAVEKGLAGAGAAAQQGAAAVPQGIQVGLQPIPGLVNSALATIGPQINEAFQGLGVFASFGMVTIANAVEQGFVVVGQRFTNGFLGLAPLVTAQFAGLSVQAALGMATFATGITQGFLAVNFAFQNGFLALAPLVTQNFAGLSVQATLGMALFAQGITQGFLAVNLAFANGFLALAPILTAQFLGLSVQVALGMATLAQAVTLGFLPINLAFQNGFLLLAPIITAQFLGLSVQFALGMATLALAITTGFLAINLAFTNGFLLLAPIITAQFAGLSVQVAMGMATIAAAVTTGFIAVNAAVTAGMTAFATEIRTGFTRVNTAVTAGLNSVIRNLNRLPPAGTATGRNLITAMANAIIAGRSQLVNAIAQVIAAAIAAATSILRIASPSKVFWEIGEQTDAGLEGGILAGKSGVVSAMESVVKDVVAAGKGIGSAFAMPDFRAGVKGDLQSSITAQGASAPKSTTLVQVLIDGEEFEGRIQTRISDYDDRLYGRLVMG